MMQVTGAEFVKSSTEVALCPKANFPEYAFIGRSNVGKSSLINMLANQNGLAKTSSTPGKTQTINHFIINKAWYLVDLPGYGFTKAPINIRKKWENFTRSYFLERINLMYTFVLLDSRHTPQKIDLDFMEWLGEQGIAFVMVFTKTDKLSSGELIKNLQKYQQEMLKVWEELPPIIRTSSEQKLGGEEILKIINDTNKLFKPEEQAKYFKPKLIKPE